MTTWANWIEKGVVIPWAIDLREEILAFADERPFPSTPWKSIIFAQYMPTSKGHKLALALCMIHVTEACQCVGVLAYASLSVGKLHPRAL